MLNSHTNDGRKIETVISTTECSKHRAEKDVPCWTVWQTSTNKSGAAVCGGRIKRAGFNGTIDPRSLSRWAKKDEPSKPKARSFNKTDRPHKVYSK